MTMSPMSPYPLPFMITPASQPAIAPTISITMSAVTVDMPAAAASRFHLSPPSCIVRPAAGA